MEDNTYEANSIMVHNCNALSSNNGDDFYIVLKEFCELIGERLPVLRPEKWSNAGEIVGDNGSIAWRILDTQYWGVPQRRRRIFLVCDLRGQSAGEVLFKPSCLRRHYPTCETPWKKFTAKTRKSVDGTDAAEKSAYRIGAYESNAMKSPNPLSGIYQTDVSATLDTSGGNPACNQGGIAIVEESARDNVVRSAGFLGSNGAKAQGIGYEEEAAPTLKTNGYVMCLIEKTVIDTNPTDARYTIADGVCQTLRSRMGTGGNNEPLVLEERTEQTLYDEYGSSVYRQSDVCGHLKTENCSHIQGGTPLIVNDEKMQSEIYAGSFGGYRESSVCNTLTRGNIGKIFNGETPIVVQRSKSDESIRMDAGAFSGYREFKTCGTLTASNIGKMLNGGTPLILQKSGTDESNVTAVNCQNSTENPDVNGTLQSHGNSELSVNTNSTVRVRSIVRRLTPLEAERLQGFEDGWTAGESDSARYKALGNSVALPCVKYIFSGIMDVLDPNGIVKNTENIN